ncbi:MAG TPA: hypothetical protein H9858_10390 [Candidatus Blautia stercoravium]|nr:hypothetical protein [Candidatus Blautia stercoravium]
MKKVKDKAIEAEKESLSYYYCHKYGYNAYEEIKFLSMDGSTGCSIKGHFEVIDPKEARIIMDAFFVVGESNLGFTDKKLLQQ